MKVIVASIIQKKIYKLKSNNTSLSFQFHTALGWAGPRPHIDHVMASQVSKGSGHSPSDSTRPRPHDLSGFQKWMGIGQGPHVSSPRWTIIGEYLNVGDTSGREEYPKGRIEAA